LLAILRTRAYAVAGANLALVGVIWVTSRYAYPHAFRVSGQNFINTDVWVAFLGATIGTEQIMSRILAPFGFGMPQPQQGAPPGQVRYGTIVIVFVLLLGTIILNFYAVGRLILASGGLLVSPYVQFAATMFILGGFMADKRRSQALIFLGGIGYFALLAYSTAFGPVLHPGLQPSHAKPLLIGITGINLVISFIVNDRTRHARG
jgi:hypothetical protein